MTFKTLQNKYKSEFGKFITSMFFFLLIFFLISGLLIRNSLEVKSNELHVDLASRQKMLVERLTWQLLDEDNGNNHEQLIDLIRRTNKALLEGGPTNSDFDFQRGQYTKPVLKPQARLALIDFQNKVEKLISFSEKSNFREFKLSLEEKQQILKARREASEAVQILFEVLTNYSTEQAFIDLLIVIILMVFLSIASILIIFFGKRKIKKSDIERGITQELLNELNSLKIALDEHSIVSVTDIKGKITFANDKFAKISLWSSDELIGRDHRLLNSGHHGKEFFKNMWETILSGKTWKGEVKNKAKNGDYYWVDTTIVPFTDSQGRVIKFISIRSEITKKKIADEILIKNHEELEVSAKVDRIGSKVMIALNSEMGTGVAPEHQLLKILVDEAGYRPIALYEYNDWSGELTLNASLGLEPGFSKVKYKVNEGLVGEVAASKYPLFIESNINSDFILDTGLGKLPLVSIFVIPLLYREKLLGVLIGGSTSRILEREKTWLIQVSAQASIGLNSFNQLQELKELSIQLTERSRKIEIQNKELALASKHKTEFLASMSHELRTPLNAIIGFSEILKDNILGTLLPAQQDYVNEVYQAGKHLLSLINDILDLAKIESGKMVLDLETIDIQSVAANAITIIKDRAHKNGVELIKNISPEIQNLNVDGRKLRQILYNLLSNAVKFTPSGGKVELNISNEGDQVYFSVNDTGIGISASDQKRLFRAFEQLDSGVARKYEGTGLGLAMVKSLVELHSGVFGVESHLGKGSCFWFKLPRVNLAETSLEKNKSQGSLTLVEKRSVESVSDHLETPEDFEKKPLDLTNKKILIIDDEEPTQDILALYFEEAGYTVETAKSVEEANSKLKEYKPDLITLDIKMPGVDGFSFLANHKANEELNSIPVLVITGSDNPQSAIAQGAKAVLAKPIRRHELIEIVNKLLNINNVSSRTRLHVMIIDDDPSAVKIIESYFDSVLFETETLVKSDLALEAIKVKKPDLILLDLMMPVVSGFDLLSNLRSNAETSKIPVVILSSKELTVLERNYLENEAEGLFTKASLSKEDLLRKIESIIEKKSSELRLRESV